MTARITLLVSFVLVLAEVVPAQTSPYHGFESREIKALSSEEQSALLDGLGMGLALAAELNQFPGPLHVLDLTDELALSEEQLQSTQTVFDEMRRSAKKLGGLIIESEQDLDRLFAERSIDRTTLEQVTAEIGELRGKLRATHLAAHLEMIEILEPSQVHRYNEIRGYGRGTNDHDPGKHHPGR